MNEHNRKNLAINVWDVTLKDKIEIRTCPTCGNPFAGVNESQEVAERTAKTYAYWCCRPAPRYSAEEIVAKFVKED